MEVSVAGDVNPDVILRVEGLPAPDSQVYSDGIVVKLGGSAANTACALSSLGAKVFFSGCVGEDLFGKMCEEWLRGAGVTPFLKRSGSTGLTVALENPEGRAMATFRGANALLTPEDIVIRGKWFHFSGFWNCTSVSGRIEDVFRKAKSEKCITSFDPGSLSKKGENKEKIIEIVEERLVDFVFMSEEEKKIIFGDRWPETKVILHMGTRGVALFAPEEEKEVIVERVKPAVRTGAGDVLNAGFIYGFLLENDEEYALKFAVKTVYKYLISGSL